MTTPAHNPVLVVGAGPVGLLLAGSLRSRGVDVALVDRLVEPTGESRASQLVPRTTEVLDRLGLLERFGALERVGSGHVGGIPLDVSSVPGAHPGFRRIPQHRTEAVLADWAVELGVDLRRGHELRDLASFPDHVDAELHHGAGSVTVRASWVVGCDGGGSTVRALAGIGFPGTGPARELLRADVRGVDVPDRRFERHPRGLAVAARRPDGVTRVMVHEFGSAPRRRDPDFTEVVAAWRAVTGEDLGGGEPLWTDAFTDGAHHAVAYRRGRVLLAGDAAHRHMPTGGHALNSGLQDADNLAWKLAATIAGHAPPGLLDTYHAERHPVGERVVSTVRAQTDLLLGGPEIEPLRATLTELAGIGAVSDHLARAACGLDLRYDLGDPHPLVGAPLPSHALGPGTPDLLRTPRGVLLDLGSGRSGPARRWRDRVDTVFALPAGGPLAGLRQVLVRPDGHVAFVAAADDPAGLEAALRRWFGDPLTSDESGGR